MLRLRAAYSRLTARFASRLNDTRGVSFLIALLCLIVAMMVIAVIVSAALVTVKQQADDETAQQRILALQSAAEVVVGKTLHTGAAGDEYCSFTLTQTDTTDADGKVTTDVTWSTTGEFRTELDTALRFILAGGQAAADYTNGKFTVMATVDGVSLDVGAKMTLRHGAHTGEDADEKNYQMVLTFTPSYEGSGEGYLYATLNAHQDTPQVKTDGNVKTTTTTWTWDSVFYSTVKES